MPALSIILPTIRQGGILLRTLEYLQQALEGIDGEVIVVNDNKKQALTLPPAFAAFTVIDSKGSGAASARNSGAAIAKGELLLFIDDDILVTRANIEAALCLHAQHPEACFNFNWRYPDELIEESRKSKFGRFILHVKLTDYKGWVPDLPWSGELFEVTKLAAFFFAIPKNVFERNNGFDENFKNQSVEDDEFTRRLHSKGIRLLIDPNEYVLHNEPDKVNLLTRLNRLKTGAFNRRQGLEMGMEEYRITYTSGRKRIYGLLSKMKPVLFFFAACVPNARLFDPLYRRIIHTLIGTVIYEGYELRDNQPVKN